MLFGKNVCAAGSTSGNIQCGMGSTESVTLTGDLFCDGATTSPFIIMQGPDAILDGKGYNIFGSNVERRGIAVRLTNGASAINCPIGNVGSGISMTGVVLYFILRRSFACSVPPLGTPQIIDIIPITNTNARRELRRNVIVLCRLY